MAHQAQVPPAHPAARRWTIPQTLALLIGLAYTAIGIIGFFMTGFDNFTEHTGEKVLVFAINPLHNVVHLAIGVLGILMSLRLGSARAFGWLLFLVYGAAFVYGLFAVDREDINFLDINWADNWLHLGSSLLGLLIALWPVRRAVTADRTEMGTVGRPG